MVVVCESVFLAFRRGQLDINNAIDVTSSAVVNRRHVPNKRVYASLKLILAADPCR
jgi:hypothetical protein